MIYTTCQQCGANLDPGEKCDCQAGDQYCHTCKILYRPMNGLPATRYTHCPRCGAEMTKSDIEAYGLKRLGTCTNLNVNGGKPLPMYDMDNFLNTKEGWNLRAKCHREKNMEPYRKAQAEWERKQKETAPDAGTSKGGSKVVIDQDNTHSIHPSTQRAQGEV